MTERSPGACQLDKGAAPPYNPPLLVCGQHFWLFGPTIPKSPVTIIMYPNYGNLGPRMGAGNGSQPGKWSQPLKWSQPINWSLLETGHTSSLIKLRHLVVVRELVTAVHMVTTLLVTACLWVTAWKQVKTWVMDTSWQQVTTWQLATSWKPGHNLFIGHNLGTGHMKQLAAPYSGTYWLHGTKHAWSQLATGHIWSLNIGVPKFDPYLSPCEFFRSISLNAWEE